jgi:hypothetical protein
MTAPRSDRLSKIPSLLLALLLLPAAAAAAPAATSSLELRAEMRGALAPVADGPVRVRCSIPPAHRGLVEALGHVVWSRRLIELAPGICRGANSLVQAPAAPYSNASFLQARALLVSVHESVHLSAYAGREDEALTECRAIQLVRETALLVGVDDDTARALGHEAMRYDARFPGPGNWMVGLHEIPNYHSPDCHDGGPLDIHPDSSDWPN